ncbi:MAG: TrkA family potassium uptake protein [Erysipelotrichaceae bacterium]
MKNNIILIGGYQKAISLSKSLISKGNNVTVINNDYENCLRLAEIEGLNVIQGDGTKAFVLEDANAGSNYMAIALTQRDDDNLVICELCKKLFHVEKTVALVSDPEKTDFFYQMGIDSVVCAISVISNYIEQQAFMKEFKQLSSISQSNVQIVEVKILANYPIINQQLKDINLPKESNIACIIREDHSIIPDGNTQINAQDTLILVSTMENQKDALKVICGR